MAPPLPNFESMCFSKHLLRYLRDRTIEAPTTFQMQALPIILEGSNFVAQGPAGCGKTICFVIPTLLRAFQQEAASPWSLTKEGPYAVFLSDTETGCAALYDTCRDFIHQRTADFPRLRILDLTDCDKEDIGSGKH